MEKLAEITNNQLTEEKNAFGQLPYEETLSMCSKKGMKTKVMIKIYFIISMLRSLIMQNIVTLLIVAETLMHHYCS